MSKAFVFDFDGVILDSANIKTEAFQELFNQFPEHQGAIKGYHLEHQGISRFNKFEWIYQTLLQKPLPEAEKQLLGQRFSALVFEKILAASFIPGAFELLQYLKSREIPAFIASGTPQEELEVIVAERGLNSFFREVWGSPKSKESIILDILERFSWQPSDLIFFGDAKSDYQAALLTEVSFIAVNSKEMQSFWIDSEVEIVNSLVLYINKQGSRR